MSCICSVCSCGLHKCPELAHRKSYDFPIISETRASFQAYPSKAPTHPVSKQTEHRPSFPFEGSSTYTIDYPPVSVRPSTSLPAKKRVHFEVTPLAGQSTQRREFVPMPPSRLPAYRPASAPVVTAGLKNPVRWTTEARDSFRENNIQPVQKRTNLSLSSTVEHKPFEGSSTYQTDYLNVSSKAVAQPRRKREEGALSTEFRTFKTEYNNFRPFQVYECPAKYVSRQNPQDAQGHISVRRL
jgi:hypothetical protein